VSPYPPEPRSVALPAQDLLPHLELPASSDGASAAKPPLGRRFVEALLSFLVECELTDASYTLHMEAMAALLVCMSTQMFCDLSSAAPQPLAVAVLRSEAGIARRMVARLLQHYMRRPVPPKEALGLLRAISSAAGFVLYLPWQVFSYFFRPADAPPLELADRALQVLLVLTQHLPPTLFAGAADEGSNEFLKALRSFSDDESRADAAADPEGGHGHQLSFRELHNAVSAALPGEASVLLLYLLLHGNRDFLDYCITRTDADALLLPLLRPLYEAHTLRPNQLYMLLIAILMLSQDEGFIAAAQSTNLPSVPWYKERILQNISLGSLLVIVMVHVVKFNLASLHDFYVHQNCLAALANMAPGFKQLHPHAARCLVSLYERLARKVLRLSSGQQASSRPAALSDASSASAPDSGAEGGGGGGGGSSGSSGGGGAGGSSGDGGDGGASDGPDELATFTDFLRIALEAINLALERGLGQNEHLVYALLERQAAFAPLREHERFWDLIENIDLVLRHFSAGLQPEGDDAIPPPAHSVDKVLSHIRTAARDWDGAKLHQLADLKFTYEQEAAPDEFFTPYLWSLLLEHSGIGWRPAGIVLFHVAETQRVVGDGHVGDETVGCTGVVVDVVEPGAEER
jgi:uncharacterized membrane protein YgcG